MDSTYFIETLWFTGGFTVGVLSTILFIVTHKLGTHPSEFQMTQQELFDEDGIKLPQIDKLERDTQNIPARRDNTNTAGGQS